MFFSKTRIPEMTQGTGELDWYCLRTPPQRETMAAKILRYDGLVAEIPTEPRYRRKTRHCKQRIEIRYPVASGYVLLGAPSDEPPPWRRVFRLHLIRSVVSINGVPAKLDLPGVARLLKHEWSAKPEYEKWLRTGKEFNVGDQVAIMSGPFRDFELCVQDIRDGDAIFLVSLLGREQELRVPVDYCAAIDAQAA